MTDLHALITEMADELDHCEQLLLDDRRQRHPLADRARAALAKPESIQDRIAAADAAIEASMERIRALAAPARAALANREHIFPTPSQAAECGGPCYEGNYCPEACDCGLYKPPELAEPDGPAVPEGREPASVAMQPSDEELDDWHSRCADLTRLGEAEHYWAFDLQGDEVAAVARAALARWGCPAAAPVAMQPSDHLYLRFASLEWKLGCHMSEWKAARELAYRMGKAGDELNQAHCDGVVRLLQEHLEVHGQA